MGFLKAFLIPLAVVVASYVGSGADAEDQSSSAEANVVAELEIRVTMPDGSPAVGVPVHEFGLERYTIYNKETARTDKNGLFKVSFQPGQQPDETHPLGYGIFRFLLKPDEFRWELSDIYCWAEFDRSTDVSGYVGNEGDGPDYKKWFEAGNDGTWPKRDPSSNWSYGRGVPVRRGDALKWNVQLQAGKDVEVSVVDQFAAPIANVPILVQVDLGAHSHTGAGAEIPMREVRTDASGRFTMEHTSDFSYQFFVRGHGWLYTPDTKNCLDPYLDHNLLSQGSVIQYQTPVSHDLLFVVTGKDGTPIPHVEINDVISFPSACQGGAPLGETGSDGMLHFNAPLPLEHCAWFEFKAEGYVDAVFMMKDYTPGEPIRVSMEPKSEPQLRQQQVSVPPEFPD